MQRTLRGDLASIRTRWERLPEHTQDTIAAVALAPVVWLVLVSVILLSQ